MRPHPLPLLATLALLLSLPGCFSGEKKPAPEKPATHGLTWRLLHPFARSTPSVADAVPTPAPAPTPAVTFDAPPKRGLTWRLLHPFSPADKTPVKKGLELAIIPDSATPSLGETRQLNVKIQVINHTKALANLSFPTTQRIEIIARTAEGKIIFTWSEDRTFAQEFTVVAINPGERLEYNEALPLRDMSAGRSYIVTVSIVGQAGLNSDLTITPKP